MRILTNGCSFAQGDELVEQEKSRYSYLVAKHFDVTDINISRSGNSNHMIVHATLDYLKQYAVDLVHINITFFERFMLPHNKTFIQINPSSGIDTVYDTLAKYIYSKTNPVLWYQYNYSLYYLLNDYCKSRSIPIVYTFVSPFDKTTWKKFSEPGFDLLDVEAFNVITRQFPMGVRYHPLEEAHEYYAKLLIPEMEKYIK